MSRQVADAMPHSGERLVAETRLKSRAPAWPKYVLFAVAAVLVAVAVSAVLAAQTTSMVSDSSLSPTVERTCTKDACRYECKEGLVHVGGDMERTCDTSDGIRCSGKSPVCAEPDLAQGNYRLLYALIGAMGAVISCGAVCLAQSRREYARHDYDVRQERRRQAPATAELECLYVRCDRIENYFPGTAREQTAVDDSYGYSQGHVTKVCAASLPKLMDHCRDTHPRIVVCGLHCENNLLKLDDGYARGSQLVEALGASPRLRLVILSACRTQVVAREISTALYDMGLRVYVVCYTTPCPDSTCSAVLRALLWAQQQQVAEGVDYADIDFLRAYKDAVIAADQDHSCDRFRFGDPSPYVNYHHQDERLTAMHDALPQGDRDCEGCYPPVHGEISLMFGRDFEWPSSAILGDTCNQRLVSQR